MRAEQCRSHYMGAACPVMEVLCNDRIITRLLFSNNLLINLCFACLCYQYICPFGHLLLEAGCLFCVLYWGLFPFGEFFLEYKEWSIMCCLLLKCQKPPVSYYWVKCAVTQWDNLDRPLPANFWPIRTSLPWLVQGIYLACGSQVRQCRGNAGREGAQREGAFFGLLTFKILLAAGVFCSVSINNSILPTAHLMALGLVHHNICCHFGSIGMLVILLEVMFFWSLYSN